MTSSALAAWRGRLARGFRWHALGFAGVNLILTAANVVAGPPWWALWPLVATAFLLAVHYFLCQALAADERWAEERALELNLKSYDRSHIEDIKSRHADAELGPRPEKG
jgi:hypothetical protein